VTRLQVREPDLEPGRAGRATAHHHVELVDGEQDGSNDQGDGRGTPQVHQMEADPVPFCVSNYGVLIASRRHPTHGYDRDGG
jgi:hypothetical protein